MKKLNVAKVFALAVLLLSACFSVSRAQTLYAYGKPSNCFNAAGTGLSFYINASSHWECIGNGYSKELVCKNYGFAIPAGAKILGIRVSCDVILNNIVDSSIFLMKGGAAYGNNGAHRLPIIKAPDINWGSDTSLWGGVWTAADLNDTNFGIRLRVKEIDNTKPFSWGDANVVNVRVAYEMPGSGIAEQETITPKIYPNPANGIAHISFGKPLTHAQLDVFNAEGKHLKTVRDLQGFDIDIDLSDQAAGVYFIKLVNADVVSWDKISLNQK